MTNYYSNEVTILDGIVQIGVTITSRSIVSADYGIDASSTPTFGITLNTITGVVTVTNSTTGITPNIYWTYVKDGTTNVIDGSSSIFSFERTGGFTGANAIFNCTLTIDPDVDLEVWGDIEVYLNVDPYTEGLFEINTVPVGGLAFVMDWGSPPSGVAFNPNLSNQLLSGNSAVLSTGIYSYGSISNSIWQYSDDNKVTWNEVTTQGQLSASSSSTNLPAGYGDPGVPPAVSLTTISQILVVSDLQFSEGRFYRIKVTTT